MSLALVYPHGLQVPVLDLYYLLAEINIDTRDVTYAVDRLATRLSTIRYSYIVVRYSYIRNRRVKGYLLAIKD